MSPAEQIVLLGAIVGAILVFAGALVKIYKVAKRIDGALGVDDDGRTISQRLKRVESQLFPNGGSSLSDKITRIEQDQHVMRGKMTALETIMGTYIARKDEQSRG